MNQVLWPLGVYVLMYCTIVYGFNLTANLYKPFCNNSVPPGQHTTLQYIVISGMDKMDRADVILKSVGQTLPWGRMAVVTEYFDYDSNYDFPIVQVMNTSKSLHPSLKYRYSQLKWLYSILYSPQFPPFDWLVLMDDDTFIIHSALQQLLASYNPTDVLLVAKAGEPACHIICGGAGMALSKGLVTRLTTDKRLKETLTRRFEYSILQDKRPGALFHSDVLLSHFLRDYKEEITEQSHGQIIIPRIEFKNFPPEVAMKWYRHGGKGGTGKHVVSFHRIDNADHYRALFSQYYSNSSSKYTKCDY